MLRNGLSRSFGLLAAVLVLIFWTACGQDEQAQEAAEVYAPPEETVAPPRRPEAPPSKPVPEISEPMQPVQVPPDFEPPHLGIGGISAPPEETMSAPPPRVEPAPPAAANGGGGEEAAADIPPTGSRYRGREEAAEGAGDESGAEAANGGGEAAENGEADFASEAPARLDIDAYVEAERARLTAGRFVAQIPGVMYVGEPEEVLVRLTRDAATDIAAGLDPGEGEIHEGEIMVGRIMKLELTGSAFDVAIKSEPEQAVPITGLAQWLFEITPRSEGVAQKLTLTAYLVVTILGEDDSAVYHPITSYTVDVEVRNKLWKQIVKFLDDIKWFAAFLAAIGGLILTYRKVFRRGD